MKNKIVFIIVFLSLLTKVYSMKNDENLIKEIQIEMKELSLNQEVEYSKNILHYFNFYNINYDNVLHYFGYIFSNNYKIASHIFLPKNKKFEKIFILMHGYFDHTGVLNNLIEFLINQNYAVAIYDMPGHGLSSGDRAKIDSFTTYSNIFEDFIEFIKNSYDKPLFLIGHSTGCAVAFEYLSTRNENPFKKIIFLAPLIRSNHWHVTKIGLFFFSSFKDYIPRKFTKNSSNKNFQEFQKFKDFLQPKVISLKWVKALSKWNKKILDYDCLNYSVLILQGKNDKIIDWKYNTKYLKGKIPNAQMEYFDKANHQLINESDIIKKNVFAKIDNYIKKI